MRYSVITLYFSTFFSLCNSPPMTFCVWSIHMCKFVCTRMFTCVRRLEVDVGCFLCSPLYFLRQSLTELGPLQLDRLISELWRSICFPLPRVRP